MKTLIALALLLVSTAAEARVDQFAGDRYSAYQTGHQVDRQARQAKRSVRRGGQADVSQRRLAKSLIYQTRPQAPQETVGTGDLADGNWRSSRADWHVRSGKRRDFRRHLARSFIADAADAVIEPARQMVAAVLGGRPSGCPHRFCGCALSIHVFGHSVRDLWLAANWFRFPRAAPAPSMVAVRRGHVFQLQAHLGGSTWRVWDANSGGGRIRVHARSIAGFVIVNPHGGSRSAQPTTPRAPTQMATASN